MLTSSVIADVLSRNRGQRARLEWCRINLLVHRPGLLAGNPSATPQRIERVSLAKRRPPSLLRAVYFLKQQSLRTNYWTGSFLRRLQVPEVWLPRGRAQYYRCIRVQYAPRRLARLIPPLQPNTETRRPVRQPQTPVDVSTSPSMSHRLPFLKNMRSPQSPLLPLHLCDIVESQVRGIELR